MTKEQFNFISRIKSSKFFLCGHSDVMLFIACQFALESAFGTSSLAVNAGNICGMKKPYRRMGFFDVDFDTGEPLQTRNGFAIYENWDYCIMDYFVWLSYQHFTQHEMNNLSCFIIHLRNSGYCPEKDYINKIQSIYDQFKSQKNGN